MAALGRRELPTWLSSFGPSGYPHTARILKDSSRIRRRRWWLQRAKFAARSPGASWRSFFYPGQTVEPIAGGAGTPRAVAAALDRGAVESTAALGPDEPRALQRPRLAAVPVKIQTLTRGGRGGGVSQA